MEQDKVQSRMDACEAMYQNSEANALQLQDKLEEATKIIAERDQQIHALE